MSAFTNHSIKIALCAALMPVAAAAQQRDTIRADSVRWFSLRPVVVTISKLPTQAVKANFSVSVVDRRELAATQPIYAADALRSVAGAYIDEAVGAGGPTIVRLRAGEEVFTQILMDGVTVNQNGGFFDFQGLTLTNIDRVEIARGPQSAVWGSAAMTGVVNFVSRTGTPGPPQWGLRLERGAATEKSNNYLGTASVSGGSSKLRYSGELGTSFMRGIHAVPHDVRSREGAVRIDALPTSTIDLGLTLRGSAVEGNLPVRDQGATRVPLDPNAFNERDRVIGSLVARHRFGQHWQQQLRVSSYYEDFNYIDTKDNVLSDQFFIFDESFTFNDLLRRNTAEYTLSFEPFADALRITAGGQVERESLKETTGGGIGDDQVEFDRASLAGYAEVQATLARSVDLLVGSRVEKYEEIDAEFTPRASIGIAVLPDLRLRAAAARAFKAPNLQQTYANNPFIEANTDLDAETSNSYELGADLALLDGRVGLSAAVFHQDFTNLIRTVSQENSTKQTNRNLGSSEARGVEWEVRVAPRSDLRFTSTGSAVRTEIDDNEGLDESQYPRGEELPFRPQYVVSFAIEWQPVTRFTALFRTRTIGEQFVFTERFSGQRVQIQDYTIFGLNLSYAHSEYASVYLRADNLFDREYAPAFDQRGAPLTVSLGVRLGK